MALTPEAIESDRLGRTRFQSMPIVRPNPRQAGQAPSGLLKLKSPGFFPVAAANSFLMRSNTPM